MVIYRENIAVIFTAAKISKQTKCPSVGEWIRKLWYIYTMEHYAATKKMKMTAWMDLEITVLSEISQSEKDKYRMISVKCGI